MGWILSLSLFLVVCFKLINGESVDTEVVLIASAIFSIAGAISFLNVKNQNSSNGNNGSGEDSKKE